MKSLLWGMCILAAVVGSQGANRPSNVRAPEEPLDTSSITLSSELQNLVDQVSENMFNSFAKGRIDKGFSFDGPKRFPLLKPWNELTKNQQQTSRDLTEGFTKTLIKLGFKVQKDGQLRLKYEELSDVPYKQSNGFKPHPLDLTKLQVSPAMISLIDVLARYSHNIWCKAKEVNEGYSWGEKEDNIARETPYLVHFDDLDKVGEPNRNVKQENVDKAKEFLLTIVAHGYTVKKF